MQPSVTVAAVAINGAMNACILACQILAAKHSHIASKVEKYKRDFESRVLKKAHKLEKSGIKNYLKRLQYNLFMVGNFVGCRGAPDLSSQADSNKDGHGKA